MISRPQIVYFKTFEDLYKSPYDLALWNTSLEHVLIQVHIFLSVIKFQNVIERKYVLVQAAHPDSWEGKLYSEIIRKEPNKLVNSPFVIFNMIYTASEPIF